MISRSVTRRIERLEQDSVGVDTLVPHTIVFINPDGTEASRLVLGRDRMPPSLDQGSATDEQATRVTGSSRE